MSRVEQTVDRLDRKRPGSVTGRHMCFKDMCAKANSMNQALSFGQAQELMINHSEFYANLPFDKCREYDQEAKVHIDEKNAY